MIGLRKAQNEALLTDTSIEKKQLAEETHLPQTAIKKPWTVSLPRLRHNTPSFPSPSIFFENGTFAPKRLADALLAFFTLPRMKFVGFSSLSRRLHGSHVARVPGTVK